MATSCRTFMSRNETSCFMSMQRECATTTTMMPQTVCDGAASTSCRMVNDMTMVRQCGTVNRNMCRMVTKQVCGSSSHSNNGMSYAMSDNSGTEEDDNDESSTRTSRQLSRHKRALFGGGNPFSSMFNSIPGVSNIKSKLNRIPGVSNIKSALGKGGSGGGGGGGGGGGSGGGSGGGGSGWRPPPQRPARPAPTSPPCRMMQMQECSMVPMQQCNMVPRRTARQVCQQQPPQCRTEMVRVPRMACRDAIQ